jgi:predicted phosphodiesterase
MASNIIAVQGNHEAWVGTGLPLDPIPGMSDGELQHQHWTHSRLDKPRRDYIRAMPFEINEVVEGMHLRMVHFALESDRKTFKGVDFRGIDTDILPLFDWKGADFLCFGHLHNWRYSGWYKGCYFLNPGSVGCSHSSSAPYAVVSITGGEFSVEQRAIPYDRTQLLIEYDRLEIPAKETIRKLFYGLR